MRFRRLVAATTLLLLGAVLPADRAHGQGKKTGQEIPPPRAVVDPKDVEDLKKSLADLKAKTEADLVAAKKATDAALAKAAAAEKAVTDAKAGGGDAKSMSEKLTAFETGAKDAAKAVADAASAAGAAAGTGRQRGDTAWFLTSSAFVMFMVPGLALFYGGMVRRKNVLATMMQSMAALAVVGVYWVAVGYALAFGPSVFTLSALGVEKGGLLGWSWDLVFLKGIEATTLLPQYDVPVYAHVMFQGMFAILTPALISGAIAERIRFWPFCIFMILWVTFVYCPLAHMVWAFDWFDPDVLAANRGKAAIGFLGKMGALDFAGGTVVHIAAGVAGLACCLVLGKRAGYPKMVAHPNGMVLTLLGAGLLWFGWFGFNGGSATNATPLAASAFAATQAAAAAAGLGWMLIEWLHKGKPTALGLASGIVAGLVAVTPASGFVYVGGGICIGLAAAVVCYLAVAAKNALGYDDSLDAFGIHGVGGFVGAVLTGVFCSALIQSASTDGFFAYKAHRARLEALKKDDGKLIKEAEEKAASAAADVAAKEKELNLEGLTAAAADAEKKAADAKGDAKAAAEAALKDAKDKLAAAADAVKPLAELSTDRSDAAKALAKERDDLQALADKQDDTANDGKDKKSATSQVFIQLKAAVFSVVFAFVLSLALCLLTQAMTLGNFKTDAEGEAQGLDRTEHGEVGFDFSAATESVAVVSAEPRAAAAPKGNGRFEVQLFGADGPELMKVWTDLCQPTEDPADPDFLAVYPHVTTVRGTTFRCRGGSPEDVAKRLGFLFTRHLGKDVRASKV
jgi:ammonium transporter